MKKKKKQLKKNSLEMRNSVRQPLPPPNRRHRCRKHDYKRIKRIREENS